ncbi:hypothetical protein PM082_000854 [Marasmius tenuissimus]|nr:hypothetical protein PM082_000854 [Marasmius tenuissimus]
MGHGCISLAFQHIRSFIFSISSQSVHIPLFLFFLSYRQLHSLFLNHLTRFWILSPCLPPLSFPLISWLPVTLRFVTFLVWLIYPM